MRLFFSSSWSLLWLIVSGWATSSFTSVTAFSSSRQQPQSLALVVGNARTSSSSVLLLAQKPPIRPVDGNSSPSPLEFLKPTSSKSNPKRRHASHSSSPPSSVQVTVVQTLQALLHHPQKKADLRQHLQQSYPLIPSPLLDSAMDVVSHALHSKLPTMIQECLKANGSWQHYQDEWKALLVHEAMLLIPTTTLLSPTLTATVVEALVNLLLAQVLQSLELDHLDYILSAPETRLAQLYDEIDTIQQTEMTRRQVWWFHAQRQWRRITLLRMPTSPRRRRTTVLLLGGVAATTLLLLFWSKTGRSMAPSFSYSPYRHRHLSTLPVVLQQVFGRIWLTTQVWTTHVVQKAAALLVG